MTEETISTEIPADAEQVAAGAGIVQDQPLGDAEAPKSARETMEAELAKVQAEAPEKPKDEPKAEPAKEPAKAEPREGVKPNAAPGEAAAKPSEGKVPEPPARFLPKAREVWANTPNPVKAEVARMAADHEAELSAHREAKAFRDDLKEYEDLARSHNTTVKEALAGYVDLEKHFASDPDGALGVLLQRVKMNPMQAVLAVLKSAGATPQQFAAHVMQNPGQYQPGAMPQQRPQPSAQPTPDPMAREAMEEVQALRHELQQRDIQSSVVDPFMAEHPRFDELAEDIAFFLKSGRVPENMAPRERLEVAYDMAERINPSPYREAPEGPAAHVAALASPVAGKKSIKGAPTGGTSPAMRTRSIREELAAQWPV